MREIKFRAWDKSKHEWFMGGAPFDLNFSGSYGGFYFDNDNPCNMRDADLAWVQFTGLTDKNGVEIYEGDVLSDHNGVGVVEYVEKYAAFRVNYGNGSAKWFYDYTLRAERESIEVIGDIHQNPEQQTGERT